MAAGRVTFEQMEKHLESSGGVPGPAESHGALCGMLCSLGSLDGSVWAQRLFPELEQGQALQELLQRLYVETLAGLKGDELLFIPLLPDESRPVALRIDALGQWCYGFLFGLSHGGAQRLERLSPDGREFLHDVTEMSHAASYELEESEQDERSYMELVEYLRAGVLLLEAELADGRPGAPEGTLH